MNEDKQRGLQRLGSQQTLPAGFEKLTTDKQQEILAKMMELQIQATTEVQKSFAQSKIAENDITVGLDANKELDADRKFYTQTIHAKTGSGEIGIHIKGGDTRFIVPILVILGIIAVVIIAIVAL